MNQTRFFQFDMLLGNANKSIQRLKKKYMDKYALSAAHTDCLYQLLHSEHGLTQSELCTLEGMDKSQISRVLKKLMQDGYVISHSSGIYKQSYVLTEKGTTITEEIASIILDINRYVSEAIPEDSIATFYKTFETITENLKRAEELDIRK